MIWFIYILHVVILQVFFAKLWSADIQRVKVAPLGTLRGTGKSQGEGLLLLESARQSKDRHSWMRSTDN